MNLHEFKSLFIYLFISLQNRTQGTDKKIKAYPARYTGVSTIGMNFIAGKNDAKSELTSLAIFTHIAVRRVTLLVSN